MINASEWRPKVGDEVMVLGEVYRAPEGEMCVCLTNGVLSWVKHEDLSPLPPAAAPAEPRAAWEVLEEAAEVLAAHGSHIGAASLRRRAEEIKAAAAPKVPTLAEVAVMLDEASNLEDYRKAAGAFREALARAEAEAGQ